MTTGLTPAAGGPYISVAGLVRHLGKTSRYNPVIACPLVTGGLDIKDSDHWGGVPVFTINSATRGRLYGARHALVDKLMEHEPALVHLHGLWDAGSRFAESLLAKSRMPLVLSPRGMLEPWAINHKWLKKKLFTLMFLRRLFARVDLLHATSELEADALRGYGFRQPIAVIPNGIEVPPSAGAASVKGSQDSRRLLYLGRLHVKKGLENLLRAWATAKPAAWSLTIAGIDERGYRRRLEAIATELGITGSVNFAGPFFGYEKWHFLASGDAFIHPSFSENFGIAVAEAMAIGLPVIATEGTPWAVLAQRHFGWWVPPTREALASALQEMAALPPERLQVMGREARDYALGEFSWQAIGRSMAECYDWLIGGNPPPSCIHFS